MDQHPLDVFMAPRSVAIIGASRKTGHGSFNLIENMLAFGFKGQIYPVNPLADEIMGLRAYKDVKDIDQDIDLAVVSTPRDQVPLVVEDCARLGIKGAVVVPQGFTDADQEGKALQGRLTEIAREKGIRILGPNTLGVSDAFSGFSSSFMPLKREKVPVGVICQSGVFFVGSDVFTGMVGKGIDVGNCCDLDFVDALEYFGADEDIALIFVHMEGMKRGRDFLEIARKVSRQKPIIAFKAARTVRGAQAASSHSGSLAGELEVFEAAFRQAGIISASDPEEIYDYTKAFLNLSSMNGNRLGVITFTGAGGIILVDTLQECGLEVPELSEHTVHKIKELSPDWMKIQNPLDIWPALMKYGVDHVYRVALESALKDPAIDGVICIAIAPNLPEEAYLDATGVISEIAATRNQKPVVSWLYGPNQLTASRRLEAGGDVICFPTLPRAAKTLSALHARGQYLSESCAPPPRFQPDAAAIDLLIACSRRGEKKVEGETGMRILKGWGIPIAESRLCTDLDEALMAAKQMGYPVVLKAQSPQIIHKTDMGGVVLDVKGSQELKKSYDTLYRKIKKTMPQVDLDGVLVQKMVKEGVEVFLGAKQDPHFGPVILFGSGGIYTEVWKDMTYGIAPLGPGDAERMIRETRCSAILEGARAEQGYDVPLLMDCLLRLSQMMTDMEEINAIDINPFKVLPDGGLAVDVRVML
jgi:acetyltransferase